MEISLVVVSEHEQMLASFRHDASKGGQGWWLDLLVVVDDVVPRSGDR